MRADGEEERKRNERRRREGLCWKKL